MNNYNLSALIKKILKVLSFILLLLMVMETGFQLRGYLKSKIEARIKSGTEVNILMMGDSVLGNKDLPDSVFVILESKLKKLGIKTRLIASTAKGNYTSQANFAADGLINQYHPQISIVLLGGSDYLDDIEHDKSKYNLKNYFRNYFYRTYLFKFSVSLSTQVMMRFMKSQSAGPLVQMAKSQDALNLHKKFLEDYNHKNISCVNTGRLAELSARFDPQHPMPLIKAAEECAEKMPADEKQSAVYFTVAKAYKELNENEKSITYLKLALPKNPHQDQVYYILYWIYFEKNNCQQMTEVLEKTLTVAEPNRRTLWALRLCFIAENNQEAGVEYFKNLAPRLNLNKNLSLMVSESLRTGVPSSSSVLTSISPEENYYYVSMLQYYKMNSMKKEANELFVKKDLYLGPNQYIIDIKNYRELVVKLKKNQKKVFVLQYPNQPDWPVLEAISPMRDEVTFISLAKVFENNLDNHYIGELLSDDFSHLSAQGSEIVAGELYNRIARILKKD